MALALLGGLLVEPHVAHAHPTTSFTLCAAYQKHGGACLRNATYLYGDIVFLRGEVTPPHSDRRAGVWRRDPHTGSFHRVGTAGISDTGAIRWRWKTHRSDAVQDAPYRFQLRIGGHGVGTIAKVWVLVGE